MTDLLEETFSENELPDQEYDGPTCAYEGCVDPLPLKGEQGFAPMRKYCDEHRPQSHKKTKVEGPRDAGPASVTFNVGTKPKITKADRTANEVEEGATELLKMLVLMLSVTTDDVCLPALAAATPALAQQLGALSKYHPSLKKVFVASDGSAEVWVWLGLLLAASPVVVTVLVHHGLLPPAMAERFARLAAAS